MARTRRSETLAREQKAVDHAYACLAQIEGERSQLSTLAVAASNADASALQRAWDRELDDLDLGRNALTFLHVDVAEKGPVETFYIGRRLVQDEAGEPVVLKWTAPKAVHWRQATPDAPGPVQLLRQLTCDGQQVLRYFDQIAAEDRAQDPDDASMPGNLAGLGGTEPAAGRAAEPEMEWDDPLLAELDRARDGVMHDIVETIQREQLALVVEQPSGVLVVQGGPGTGKTAVGLHRITWLLDNRHSVAGDVLVVGPSRHFLDYVGTLLPQLGTRGVTLLDLPTLWTARTAPVDPAPVRRIKSDLRMAQLLRQVIEGQTVVTADQLVARLGSDIFTFELRGREIVVPLSEIADIATEAMGADAPYLVRRTGCRRRVVDHLAQAYVASLRRSATADYFDQIDSLREVQRLLGMICPELTESAVLAQLWKSRSALQEAADGILTEQEQEILFAARPASAPASAATRTLDDLVCLDEIGFLLRGRTSRTYSHIVIDEAQDLTPMQARSLARRCPSSAMTVLGDLAQATGPRRYQSWDLLANCLASKREWRLAELVTGFRVPSEVMDFAGPLGAACAADVAIPASVRTTGIEVQLRRTNEPVEDALAQVRGLQQRTSGSGRSVAVIVPDGASWERNVQIQLHSGGAEEEEPRSAAESVTVIAASECKGLEFDHVVVVEPTAIASGDDAGLNRLYVALTRCTQSLSVYYRAPLPAALSGEGSPIPVPSTVFKTQGNGTTGGPMGRQCSRYHAGGRRCSSTTSNPDSWCREEECGGFRTSQPMTDPGRNPWLKPLTGGDPRARLTLSVDQLKRLRVTSTAQQEFQRLHCGNPREAAVELHAMVTSMLADGTHHRAANGYWYLEHLGYRLVLSPEADAVTNYRAAHLERSYAQVQAGIPSRAGKDARAQRRSAMTSARGDRGEWLERADASSYAPAGRVHVTATACSQFERTRPESRSLPDSGFIQSLRSEYAADLVAGTPVLREGRHVLVGSELAWSISGDGRAIVAVRMRTPEDLAAGVADAPAPPATSEEPVSTVPSADLRKIVAGRVQMTRQDRAHEALRHRLLADLYEWAVEPGSDDVVDAWTTVGGERVLYEVVVPGDDQYADMREAAAHLLEVAYLHDREGADHLVLVMPGAPRERWIEDAIGQAFSIKLLWREGGTWTGSGRPLAPVEPSDQ